MCACEYFLESLRTDVGAWANEQAALLCSGQLSAIYIENIAEKILDVGKSNNARWPSHGGIAGAFSQMAILENAAKRKLGNDDQRATGSNSYSLGKNTKPEADFANEDWWKLKATLLGQLRLVDPNDFLLGRSKIEPDKTSLWAHQL